MKNNTTTEKPDAAQASSWPLAELISAVLNHPECPTEIYQGLADGVTDTYNNLYRKGQASVSDSAPYIDVILRAWAERGADA